MKKIQDCVFEKRLLDVEKENRNYLYNLNSNQIPLRLVQFIKKSRKKTKNKTSYKIPLPY